MELEETRIYTRARKYTFLKDVTNTENIQKCKTGVQLNPNANKMSGQHFKDLEEQTHEEVGEWQNVTFLSLLFTATTLQLLKCNLRLWNKRQGRMETCLETSHARSQITSVIGQNCH